MQIPKYFYFRVKTDRKGLTLEIEDASDTDVAEVVRCRECRHRDPEDHKCDCGQIERQGCPFPVDDDYFCKHGARREWGDDDDNN